jgi:hypothetical protein
VFLQKILANTGRILKRNGQLFFFTLKSSQLENDIDRKKRAEDDEKTIKAEGENRICVVIFEKDMSV